MRAIYENVSQLLASAVQMWIADLPATRMVRSDYKSMLSVAEYYLHRPTESRGCQVRLQKC